MECSLRLTKKQTRNFEKKFVKGTSEECWIWTAGKHKYGYGRLKIYKHMVLAHRVSYELYVGQVPHGMRVLHHCDNPPCVNPNHLFLGTKQDNSDDKYLKNRQRIVFGEESGMSKLTVLEVIEIRKLLAERKLFQHEIAKLFSVDNSTISSINNRDTWDHIK